jgi:hypothetical protein
MLPKYLRFVPVSNRQLEQDEDLQLLDSEETSNEDQLKRVRANTHKERRYRLLWILSLILLVPGNLIILRNTYHTSSEESLCARYTQQFGK